MRLTRKLMFAIEAVVDIAFNAAEQPVRSGEITRRQGIPRRYLEQVLQHLVRAGILDGVRGPRGGYRLARERRRITVGEITRIVRAMETAADPLEEPTGSDFGLVVLRPLWLQLHDEFMAQLDNITVEDLCRQAEEKGVVQRPAAGQDYMI